MFSRSKAAEDAQKTDEGAGKGAGKGIGEGAGEEQQVVAAEVARLKAWTGTLLKRHGLEKKGQQGGVGGSS